MNETTPTPAEQERKTRITTVSVKIKRELDIGFMPFMRYVRKNGTKNIPFGMRDASRATFDIFLSAELGDDMNAEQLALDLSQQGHAIADRELRRLYPEAFSQNTGAKPAEAPVATDVPDEAFTIGSTIVETAVEEY